MGVCHQMAITTTILLSEILGLNIVSGCREAILHKNIVIYFLSSNKHNYAKKQFLSKNVFYI